ncbi:ATP-grasp domain-containing protein [Lactococcus lactis]|uniref:ATP-grasp domain-containing protein n=1 Tax=Lactococcus lactis TaxID=1358 RepID=UPI0024A964EC|nr:ATP-grasp domain-containing protein [Lactococcus lactis]
MRILFLAQFAPNHSNYIEPKNDIETFYAETYHHQIYNVLIKSGHEIISSNNISYLLEHHKEIDLVWSFYNRIGFRNSEIFVQSLCEYLNVSYIGATPNVRALVEDKHLSKNLAEHLDILTADWQVGNIEFPLPKNSPFKGPYFIKPRFGSGSEGIDETCYCNTWEEVKIKEQEFYKEEIEVIVEQFLNGKLYGVPFIKKETGELFIGIPHFSTSDKKGNIINTAQKRRVEGGMKMELSKKGTLNKKLTSLSKHYFLSMQPADYGRIDFIVDANDEPYFLEVNTMMNLGIHSGAVLSFLNSGFTNYEEIILSILNLGIARVNK